MSLSDDTIREWKGLAADPGRLFTAGSVDELCDALLAARAEVVALTFREQKASCESRQWRELAEGLRNMLDAETARYRRLEEAARAYWDVTNVGVAAAYPEAMADLERMVAERGEALRSVLDGEQ